MNKKGQAPKRIRLKHDFFKRDVLEVAPDLIGKILVRKLDDGTEIRSRIIEDEAYRAPDDLSCHASKGRTPKTEIFFHEGGHLYIFLCYGIHFMLNIVTSIEENPQAVLIRSVEGAIGPGKVTKFLHLDSSFYGEDTEVSKRFWVEDDGTKLDFQTGPRINIDYAGEPWITMPWRFFTEEVANHGAKPTLKAQQAMKKKEKQKMNND